MLGFGDGSNDGFKKRMRKLENGSTLSGGESLETESSG